MKLNSIQVKEICRRYVQTDKTLEELADEYKCSPSTLSKSIYRAIYYGDIDEELANKVKNKVVGNVDIKLQELGYHKSRKVGRKYDWIMKLSKRRKALVEKIESIEFDIKKFESTYSDADEYPFSKESLEDAKEKLQKELNELDKEFKKGRK